MLPILKNKRILPIILWKFKIFGTLKMFISKKNKTNEINWSNQWDYRLTGNANIAQAQSYLIKLQKKIEKKEKEINKLEKDKPTIIQEKSIIGFRLTLFEEDISILFLKIPLFFNCIIPIPIIPLVKTFNETKHFLGEKKEEKHKSIKFPKLKRYFFYFLILWLFDWYETKKMCENKVKLFKSPFEVELAQLRRILRCTVKELYYFQNKLQSENKSMINSNDFGWELAKHCSIWHETINNRPMIETFPKTVQENGEFFVRPHELFQWDILCLLTQLNKSTTKQLPLWYYMTSIGQLVTDELAEKATVGFRVLQRQKKNKKGLTLKDLAQLLEVMAQTGHFEKEALYKHKKWLLHQYEFRTNEKMAEIIFKTSGIPKDDIITLEFFQEALMKLGNKKWYFFLILKMPVWYCIKFRQQKVIEKYKNLEKKRKKHFLNEYINKKNWWYRLKEIKMS